MKILIKGAGDLATGVAAELYEAGHNILMTEIAVPLTVRRQVAFSKAVYAGETCVEGITARRVANYQEAASVMEQGDIAVIVDPKAKIKEEYHPDVVIDAILAKKNIGTQITDAPCVIALGPGFEAGKDCYAVIETMRGITLGQPIYEGRAIPDTGVPGIIGGYGLERLIKASSEGKMKAIAQIGDVVKKGEILAMTGDSPVYAQIDGIIRGMLQDDVNVTKGMKIGDVDPRSDSSLVHMISDKSRKIGQGVKTAIRRYFYSSIGIVLLAAGRSVRYGSNKLLAKINGKPMFSHVIDTLSSFPDCKKVIVTRFPEIEEYAVSHNIVVETNHMPEDGISRSLKLGIKKMLEINKDCSGIFFAVCDQPYLTEKSMDKLLGTAAQHRDLIIRASCNGKPGNPVYWGNGYFDSLMKLSGDVGGRQIMTENKSQILLCEIPEKELEDVDKSNS